MVAKSNKPITDSLRRYTWLVAFAIAMAFVEAAVVVYLRRIFYPDGFVFPLRVLELVGSGTNLLAVEVAREVATMVVLSAVAVLTGRSWPQRWAWLPGASAPSTLASPSPRGRRTNWAEHWASE